MCKFPKIHIAKNTRYHNQREYTLDDDDNDVDSDDGNGEDYIEK